MRPAADRGSTLILGLGLVVVCVLAGVVAIDVGAAHLQRRNLLALADAAALAGAQAIDLDAYYRDGASAATALDARSVPVLVRRHLAATLAQGSPASVAIERIAADADEVVVRLSVPLDVPLWRAAAGAVLGERVVVEAHARLAYREAGP